jgi:hypothetical protein
MVEINSFPQLIFNKSNHLNYWKLMKIKIYFQHEQDSPIKISFHSNFHIPDPQ